jgi:preprotein translocase subunit SecY
MQINFVLLTLWVAGFLFVLNIVLAIVFRKQSKRELLSYAAACVLELMIFVFALFYQLGVLSRIPFHFPPGLPFNSIQVGAALAFGLGLFPAAFWHRTNISDLPRRIAEDASTMKGQQAGVRIRKPGEWIN